MDQTAVIEGFRGLMLGGFEVVAPILLVSLVVAVVVGIAQAVTQIQEQSLAFFPKLLVLGLTMYFLAPWMLQRCVEMIQAYVKSIASLL